MIQLAKFKATELSVHFFLSLLLVLITFPLLIFVFPFIPQRSLNGIAMQRHAPAFSLRSLNDGTFQKSYENWFMKGNRLWPWFVMLNNQLNYEIFRQISTTYNTTVFLGKEGYLFQSMYLSSINNSGKATESEISERARDLKILQDLLKERGVPLIVVISTNMPALYPELIPNSFLDPTRNSRPEGSAKLLFELRKNKVNFIDAHSMLKALSKKSPIRFFERGGSHWNDIGSCLVVKEVFLNLTANVRKPLLKFNCDPYAMEMPPRTADRDLLGIANLLLPRRAISPSPYVTNRAAFIGPVYRPNLLFIGTSFNFALIDQLYGRKAIEHAMLYFYYNRRRDETGRVASLDRSRIDWENRVFNRDAIIIEENQSRPGRIGFSFVKDAIRKLQESKSNNISVK